MQVPQWPVLLLLVMATPVRAGVLYKCSDGNGQVSIQSQACPAGSTQLWKRDASPEAAPTPEQVAAAEAKSRRESATARELSLTAGTTQAQPVPVPVPAAAPSVPPESDTPAIKGPCRRAHELADGIRALEWLELDAGQRLRLERWVVDQCEQARIGD